MDVDADAGSVGDDEPPLNLASRADCMCRDERPDDECPCVQIYGHEYSIDNAADFSNILQPSYITGNDVELVCAGDIVAIRKSLFIINVAEVTLYDNLYSPKIQNQ